MVVLGGRVARHARVVPRVPRLQLGEGERRRELVDGGEGDAEVVVGAQFLLLATDEPLEPGERERER